MVLKRGKFNANSGNTLRRIALRKTAIWRELSFVSKKPLCGAAIGSSTLKRISISENAERLTGTNDIKYSLNKKNRWKYLELLQDNFQQRKTSTEKRNESIDDGQRKSKETKKSKKIPKKTLKRLYKKKTKTYQSRGSHILKQHSEKTMLDTNRTNPVKKSNKREGNCDSLEKDHNATALLYKVEATNVRHGFLHHRKFIPHLEIVKNNHRCHLPRKMSRKSKPRKVIERPGEDIYICSPQSTQNTCFKSTDDEESDVEDMSFAPPIDSEYDLSCYLLKTVSNDKEEKKVGRKRSKKQKMRDKKECHSVGPACDEDIFEYPKGSMTYIKLPEDIVVDRSTSDSTTSTVNAPVVNESYGGEQWLKLDLENQFSLVVDKSEISVNTLASKFGIAHIEGLSSPRTFVISVGLCTPQYIVLTKSRTWTSSLIAVKVSPQQIIGDEKTVSLKLKVIDDNPVASELFTSICRNQQDKGEKTNFEYLIYQFVNKYYDIENRSRTNRKDKRKSPQFIEDLSVVPSKFSKWYSAATEQNLVYISSLFERSRAVSHESSRNVVADVSPKLPIEGVCSICLETVPQSDCTMLNECSHKFCNSCWGEYLRTQIGNGLMVLKCPETKCETCIDVSTVAFLVPMDFLLKLMKNTFETKVLSKYDYKWCPGCQKLVKISYQNTKEEGRKTLPGMTSPSVDGLQDTPVIHCECGNVWCFACEEKPHWPAPCAAYKNYKILFVEGAGFLFDDNGNPFVTEVDVKKCPFCKIKIDKSYGCYHMSCVCGNDFCWNCLQGRNGHNRQQCREKTAERIVFSSLEKDDNYYQDPGVAKIVLKYTRKWQELKKLARRLNKGKEVEKPSDGSDDVESFVGCNKVLLKTLSLAHNALYLLQCISITKKYTTLHSVDKRMKIMSNKIASALEKLKIELSRGTIQNHRLGYLAALGDSINSSLGRLKFFSLSRWSDLDL